VSAVINQKSLPPRPSRATAPWRPATVT